MDGFDGNAGRIELDRWRIYVTSIVKKLNIKKDDSIFEIGCGAGAFLYTLHILGYKVGGIDYSMALVNAGKQIWEAQISYSEAINCDINPIYDVVISNSVFHYFPNLDYAEEVIQKMIKKSKKTIAILELPNKDLYEISEKTRANAVGVEEYRTKYAGFQHLYFEKDWLEQIGKKYHLKTTIFDQQIHGYKNSPFRFNCIFEK